MSLSVPAQAANSRRIRGFVEERAREAALPPSEAFDLLLAVSEVCNNAIAHSGSEGITVRWETKPGRIEVEVRDEGVYGRASEAQPGEGGLGWKIIRSLVDEVQLERGTARRPGTVVRMVKFTSVHQGMAAS